MSDQRQPSVASPVQTTAPFIEMRGVNKWFGQFHALKDIDLDIARGAKLVICGPSGSGKSTLIRCLNRLEEHDEGRIVVDGTVLDEDTHHIAAVRREVGMVFQQFNLFPHLTVLENCVLAQVRARKTPRRDAANPFARARPPDRFAPCKPPLPSSLHPASSWAPARAMSRPPFSRPWPRRSSGISIRHS